VQHPLKPVLREVVPFQYLSDPKQGFPDPLCVFSERVEVRWLDAVKLRHVLDHETATHRDMFCNYMIKELHLLSNQSNLPYLSKAELLRNLEDPKFALLPTFEEELRMLASNLKTKSDFLQSSHAYNLHNRIVSEGGNFFSAPGSTTTGTDISPQLMHHWKSQLASKVQYSVAESDREKQFQDQMMKALKCLHNQSRLEHLNGDQWRGFWKSHSFEKFFDIQVRGMITNIAMEVVSLNFSIFGRHFMAVLDEAKEKSMSAPLHICTPCYHPSHASIFRASEANPNVTDYVDVDSVWKRMLCSMLPHPRPPPLRLTNLNEMSKLDVIKVR
jgi:hypothetical protein